MLLLPCDALVPLGPAPIPSISCLAREGAKPEGGRQEDRGGVWGTPPNHLPPPLRRVPGPHCFEAHQTGGCGAFLSSAGSCLSEEPSLGSRRGLELYLQPLGPQGPESEPLLSPLCQSGQQWELWKMLGCWGTNGSRDGVPGMEDPGKCSSGRLGARRVLRGRASWRGQRMVGEGEGGKTGQVAPGAPQMAARAKLAGDWGQSQVLGREKGREGERKGQSVHRWRCPLLSPTLYFFFLLLETFSPHPEHFPFFLCFTSHHRCHFFGKPPPPQPG